MCPHEAIYRLFGYKMHDSSHTIIRLPVHLLHQQQVQFVEGAEEEALLQAQNRKTKLESWFELNVEDDLAHEFLYVEIPLHYVYVKGKWEKRQRGAAKIIPRMYSVSVKDEERFYLRMMLLHVHGATSYETLRTFDDTIYDTFKAAAIARGLLANDEEWNRCLVDGGTFQMPRELREIFAYICCFCMPTNPLQLWTNHRSNLCLDYLKDFSEVTAINNALYDVEKILIQHGMSCASIGLPVPTGTPALEVSFDCKKEAKEGEQQQLSLNTEQKEAFLKIMAAVENKNEEKKCFFLDGPGGSGKTYLYSTLMSVLRGRGNTVLPFATTGIAATLLKGGRTVHSGLKLPVPLLDTSVSRIGLNSSEADTIRQAVLIIVDEITMLPKHGLRCIDKLFREITEIDKPFGSKVFVIGGDFRQTLPVVPRGSRTEIIETSIKSSPLWKEFTSLKLFTNMRCKGQNQHNSWLLQLGEGTLPTDCEIDEEDIVEIPRQMITNLDLCDVIFGDNLQTMAASELSQRIIVAPTNARTLEMNNRIISKLSGAAKTYLSADSIVSEDNNDIMNYPIEFLNSLTPSGMAPHILTLKKGAVVMLLRNLNPKKGLCNGTRLIIEEMRSNFVLAKIISQGYTGETVMIPRIDLAPSDTLLPFVLKRRQLPLIPAYCITINKSQGQSFEHVGVELENHVFSHGQLYVALSRSKQPKNIHVTMNSNDLQGELLADDRYFTKNVVFKEIFNM